MNVISKLTPWLLTASAILMLILWVVDENMISPAVAVIGYVCASAMGWINYGLKKHFDMVSVIAERAIAKGLELSDENERMRNGKK